MNASAAPREHLAFTVAGRPHALPLDLVQEVLRLPMLQPAEAPAARGTGLFNLRGQVVNVLDLARSLGLPCQGPRLGDHLILLRGSRKALWVQDIEGVVTLSPLHDPEREAPSVPSLLAGVASLDSGLYHLLDGDRLLEVPPAAGEDGFLMAGLDPSDQAVLEARALAYREEKAADATASVSALMFEWSREGFAVDLAEVREIVACPSIHPLPGAPAAYLGLASHRGEPLLVMDLRPRMELPAPPPEAGAKLLVVEEDAGRLGLYVDEVHGVLQLEAQAMQPPIRKTGPWEWIAGTWLVDERPVSLVRLRSLLAHPDAPP